VNIVALIPARAGSKTVPDKNIRRLGKHPLIAYSIAAAKLSRLIREIIVSTDSEHIAGIARRYGASVPFLRPREISQDDSLDIEFFLHYFEYLKKEHLVIPDLAVHLRPTTPLRDVDAVDKAIRHMMTHAEATGLRSMHKTRLTPYKMFCLKGGYARPFMDVPGGKEFYNWPRQRFEDAYVPDGIVDVIRPEVVHRTGTLHGDKMALFETDAPPDIDEPKDFISAGEMLGEERFKPLSHYLERSA